MNICADTVTVVLTKLFGIDVLNKAEMAVNFPARGILKAKFVFSSDKFIGLSKKFCETAEPPKPMNAGNPGIPPFLVLIRISLPEEKGMIVPAPGSPLGP